MTLITGLPTNKANVRKLFKIYFKNYIYNYIFMCICNIAFSYIDTKYKVNYYFCFEFFLRCLMKC